MASAKLVTVLTPNGRRQNVKVTPNTTILQVLEEVCTKHDLKPDEYDVKHHNKILDVSIMIRFSGLPNNAQLEMYPIQKTRAESVVILMLQLENGTRLTGNYNPNENLFNILMQLCPDETKSEDDLMVIYMRKEIYGVNALRNTNLKSLGLTSGRAMIRVMHRQADQLKTQANVSVPLPYKEPEEKPIRKLQKLKEPEPPKSEIKQEQFRQEQKIGTKPKQENKNFITDFVKKEKSAKRKSSTKSTERSPSPPKLQEQVPEEEFVFLGERNALAFSLETAVSIPHEELPDEFFELTIQDARKLLRDLKRKRMEMEESPLQTEALRKLEHDKKVLRYMNQYRSSVIRIQFPDRTVLQGTFKPIETVNDIKKFVSGYLHDPRKSFNLYTTPPKSILDTNATLIDADCVPNAVIYFAFDHPQSEGCEYLRGELFDNFISHSLASMAAIKTRGNERIVSQSIDDNDNEDIMMNDNDETNQRSYAMEQVDETINVGASTSTQQSPSGPKEKVPKWFKHNK